MRINIDKKDNNGTNKTNSKKDNNKTNETNNYYQTFQVAFFKDVKDINIKNIQVTQEDIKFHDSSLNRVVNQSEFEKQYKIKFSNQRKTFINNLFNIRGHTKQITVQGINVHDILL